MQESPLFQFLSNFHAISDSLISESGLSIKEIKLKKGENFIQPGDHSGVAGIVVKGLCRQFYVSKSGKEHNKYFHKPGDAAIAYAEILSNVPVRCYIQAMTDTTLQTVSHPNFNEIYDLSLESQKLGRKIAEQKFIEKEQREFELLLLPRCNDTMLL